MSDKTTISMIFPKELLKKIDRRAQSRYSTRSDYIRQTLINSIEKEDEEFTDEVIAQMADELDATIKAQGLSDKDIDRMMKETRREVYAEQQRKTAGNRT